MFSYKKIFKQAFQITGQHKFLWIFGLFLLFGNVLNFLASWFDQSQIQIKISNLGYTILFLVSVLVIVLFFRSKAALIIAIKAIIDKEPTSAGKAFSVSQLFFSRILGISVIVELALGVLLAILASPISFMFDHHFITRGIILIALGLIIFIPTAVVGTLLNALVPMFVVIYDQTFREAVNRSFEMISEKWLTLLGIGFVLFVIEILAFFLLLPIVFLWNLPYHREGLILSIIGLVLFVLLQSLIAVFQQSAWVLAFLELIKPAKMEEEETVVAPEAIT